MSIACHVLPMRCCYLFPIVVLETVAFLVQADPWPSWVWVKNRYPKWNPGKWKHGLKPAVPWGLILTNAQLLTDLDSGQAISTAVALPAQGRPPLL